MNRIKKFISPEDKMLTVFHKGEERYLFFYNQCDKDMVFKIASQYAERDDLSMTKSDAESIRDNLIL